MIGLGRAIDRGLYRVGRVWEDWSPFALFVVIVAAVFGLAAAIWTTVARYTAHDWHIFGVYVLSEILLVAFAPDKTKKIRDFNGEDLEWTIEAISRHSYILDLRDRMLGDAFGAAQWGGGIGAGLLIGAVIVVRIVHWRKARKRRRGAEGKRAALASRRQIGLLFDRILRCLPAPVRFVRKSITRHAVAGSAEREAARPSVANRRAVDSAAGGFGQGGGIEVAPAASGEPTVRPTEAARPARRGGTKAAKAYWDRRQRALGRHPDSGETRDRSPATPPPATSPAGATASATAAQSGSADPSRFLPTSRTPHSPGHGSNDASPSDGGDGALPVLDRSRERAAAAGDDGSDNAVVPTPQDGRAASDERMPGSNQRPLGTRLGARRRRRRASQDFY